MAGSSTGEPIAIIGIGCRFPGGADTPERFWQNLCARVDGISEVPSDRWNVERFYAPEVRPGKATTKWGGFVDRIADFDAQLFNISPREAEAMDPQQRLLLHAAWSAFEDAEESLDRWRHTPAGVFIGVSVNDYKSIQDYRLERHEPHCGTGTALSITANRISNRLDFTGPSVAVDTACSSSLVALDVACRSLREGACPIAMVGGVNAVLTPYVTIAFDHAGMMSATGRLRAFDAAADGYVRGEGVGVVVLKPLSLAERDGNRVYAVIRATGVNQNGASPSITMPSREAQQRLFRTVAAEAGLAPRDVAFVEAHGTGTPVGDPIEMFAIGSVFGRSAGRATPLPVGSVKPNIGHLESAAGVAGLIKTALSLHHGRLPPSINFADPNPTIDFAGLGIEVPTETVELDRATSAAVVNSFGFGGTNASAVLQAPPPATVSQPVPAAAEALPDTPVPVPVSAPSPERLADYAGLLADHVSGDPSLQVRDVAAQLSHTRASLAQRAVVLARDRNDLIAGLRRLAGPNEPQSAGPQVITGRGRVSGRPWFVFSGQGGQWWAMGRDLLEHDAIFRRTVEEVDRTLAPLCGFSLVDELLAGEARSRMDDTRVTQAAIFALQLGLVARWQAWGIEPAGVVGHSFGEVAAAHVAGALSLTSACRVIHRRSELQYRTHDRGRMVAVGASAERARELMAEHDCGALELAALNARELVTVSGDRETAERFVEALAEHEPDLFVRMVRTSYAFHSRQMDPLMRPLGEALSDIEATAPRLAMMSTVSGGPMGHRPADAAYWQENMRRPVRFAEAIGRIVQEAEAEVAFLEIGPDATLAGPLAACLAEEASRGVVVPSLGRGKPDRSAITEALARLQVAGVDPDWRAVHAPSRRIAALPPLPLHMRSFWPPGEEARRPLLEPEVHPLLGLRVDAAMPTWRKTVDVQTVPFLADHRVGGDALFPAAGYLELMLAAARETLGCDGVELVDIAFLEAMFLSESEADYVHTVFDPRARRVSVWSRTRDRDEDWTLRAEAKAYPLADAPAMPENILQTDDMPATQEAIDFYAALGARGHDYGTRFRGVEQIWSGDRSALGTLLLPEALEVEIEGYLLHPVLFDSALHVCLAIALEHDAPPNRLLVPVGIDRLRFHHRPGVVVNARAELRDFSADELGCDLWLVDGTEVPVAVAEGFRARPLAHAGAADGADGPADLITREAWRASSLPPDEASLTGRQCIVLDPRGGAGAFEAALREAGADVVRHAPVDADTGALCELLRAAADREAGPSDILLWLDQESSRVNGEAAPFGSAFQEAQTCGASSLLAIVHALLEAGDGLRPRLWIVTRGARWVLPADAGRTDAGALLDTPVAGLARTVFAELPDTAVTQLDLDPRAEGPCTQPILAEMAARDAETEVAFRGGERLVNRLERCALDDLDARRVPAAEVEDFRLTMPAPGIMDRLVVGEAARQPIPPGHVAVTMSAYGLNFRDIMAASGVLPIEAEGAPAWRALGLEGAGVISEVGEGVADLAPGTHVIVVGRGCMRSRLVTRADRVFALPEGVTLTQAAALPTAFLTAYYSLIVQGRLRPGERVLIHAGTGGVGLAAIQIAKHVGADVIASAGSAAKRDHLLSLGIAHIVDSRSLSFADNVMAATDGEGVDVVLNSLSGPFFDKGLRVLAPYGRFLEIGKRDIYEDNALALRAMAGNKSFHVIDLAGLARDRPARMQELYAEIRPLFESGVLRPPPIETYPLSATAVAFARMAQARHIGKIVMEADRETLPVALDPSRPIRFRHDASYLVTGGSSGFGLALGAWLARQGAGHVVLTSRRGPDAPEAEAAARRIEAAGAKVSVLAADATDRDALATVLDLIEASGMPLAGVFHAAMVLDDALVQDLDSGRMLDVLAPKVLGACYLHELTRALPIEHFVTFSSIAASIGARGQANYVAANLFLEEFARFRRGIGLPGLTVSWGAIGDAGVVARDEKVAGLLARSGIEPLPVAEALARLGSLMRRDPHVVGVARVDLRRMGAAAVGLTQWRRTEQLFELGRGHSTLLATLAETVPEQRRPMLMGFIAEQLGAVLRVEASKIDPALPLSDLGVDSLSSLELKTRVEASTGLTLSVGKFLARPTVEGLADAILEQLSRQEEPGAAESDRPLAAE